MTIISKFCQFYIKCFKVWSQSLYCLYDRFHGDVKGQIVGPILNYSFKFWLQSFILYDRFHRDVQWQIVEHTGPIIEQLLLLYFLT